MIVRMSKYDFVLFARQKDDFLNRLQDLGVVDISSREWEPDDSERDLMISIEKHRAASARLRALLAEKDFVPGTPYSSGEESFNEYIKTSSEEDRLTAEIAQARKDSEELAVWGDFDEKKIAELEKQGIVLRFFQVFSREFERNLASWSEQYRIVPVSDVKGMSYFVVVASPGEEVLLNAQEVKAPTSSYLEKEELAGKLQEQRSRLAEKLARAAASVDMIEQHGREEEERLRLSQAADGSVEAAEGTLILMEGWAPEEISDKVDAMLEEYPNLFYIKSEPTPDDDTPVLLKNNKFNRMFEFIGSFYSLPKYGTMDLTPFFGPFYVLFFGLCLADAGYGLIFFVAGLIAARKVKPPLKSIARLITLCGLSTMVCGTFMGSFFGIAFHEYQPFENFAQYVLDSDNLFALALGIGVFQILFGMTLKVISTTQQYGFRYSLSTLGWMIVIISSLVAFFSDRLGLESYTWLSTPHLIIAGVGVFMMLFLNSPKKNPLMNLGAGLWNTYNDVTGLLGDTLSYIRLFAIGLSGGILASVFNQLALGLSPDIPVVRQISIVLILTIGHGITLFMSTLSAFVHPMRLTFVEFYNNAGFETSQRAYSPLKRESSNE